MLSIDLTLEAFEDPASTASCPWVFPWNGSEYVADNDVYSTARGSAREFTDYYTLTEPLVPKDGQYTLELREISDEESYTDLVRLVAVDHDSDVHVAADGDGNVWTYSAWAAPISAIDKDGNDVLSQIATEDDSGFRGFHEDYVILDFSTLDVSQGATLVLRFRGFQDDGDAGDPTSVQPSIDVQTQDLDGTWTTRNDLTPREDWAVAAVDLSAHLGDSKQVRLWLKSCHTGKYHVIDYAGLDTAPQAPTTVNMLLPISATHSVQGDVLDAISASDDDYAHLVPNEQMTLAFPVPAVTGEARDFVFVSEGYYEPVGTFYVYTWDGSAWVQRGSASMKSWTDQTTSFDLSAWLPDADNEFKVRIWQSYEWNGAGIDYVGLTCGAVPGLMLSAYDFLKNRDVTAELSASDDVRDNWAYESIYQGSNRWVEVNWAVNLYPQVVGVFPADPSVGPLSSVQLDFNKAMDTTTFSIADDVITFAGPEGSVNVNDYEWLDEDTLELTFDLQYVVGTYELVLGPWIFDAQDDSAESNPMDSDRDFIPGEELDDRFTATFAVGAPEVLGHAPAGAVAGPVRSLELTFDHPMDQTSFLPEEDVISFTGPQGPLAVSGSRWLDDHTLEILFDPQSSLGSYELVLGPEVLSLWNNPLDQDGDLMVAEAPEDWYTATFTIAGAKVVGHTPSGYVTAPVQRMQFTFDQPMEQISFSPEEDVVSFNGPNGPIAITDHRWIDSQTLELSFDQQNTSGEYELVLGPQVLNLAGIAMDQDGDFNVGEEPDDQYTATFTRMFVSNITEDTVWGPIDPPIIFDSTVTVASGATLTIEAGSTLKFSSGAKLVVNGNLDIRGTLDNPVILTSYRDDEAGGDTNGDGDATSPAAGDWGGIDVNSSASANLENVEVRYASTAIDANAQYANVTLRNTILRDGGFGVYVYSPYAEVTADNCLIADNANTGI
ncbi:MAG TPA: hypothetical protein VM118_11735, partial [Acidobacteriota bacterium]|nr:hypothetical protein [Acidobacteriota bacterium]